MSSSGNSQTEGTACRRFIYTDIDMQQFMDSSTKKDLLRVVTAMGKSCSSSAVKDDDGSYYDYDPTTPLTGLSVCMASLHGSLCEMENNWLNDFPPLATGGSTMIRFGNPSFRKWHERLVERSNAIVSSILECKTKKFDTSSSSSAAAEVLQQAHDCGIQAAAAGAAAASQSTTDKNNKFLMEELSSYLQDAFGHPIRLDYGTGHESSFLVFLYCLIKLGCVDTMSSPTNPPSLLKLKATTLSIFSQYLRVTRKLQTLYRLEPAGSHGVWGLDDYHCLPFYFGACQLMQQQSQLEEEALSSPNCIHDSNIMTSNDDDAGSYTSKYLYLGCIAFIKQLKQGVPFFEHSPMLHDISQLPTWTKVSGGLLRLYEGEVLNKRQVVQHFKFGKLFPATWTPSSMPQEPPTTLFRAGAMSGVNPAGSSSAPQNNNVPFPPTRAPWASGSSSSSAPQNNNVPFPPTRAPWAK